MTETLGKFEASRGERCSNPTEIYTCPGCYTDQEGKVDKCEHCGAPLVCETETVTEYVCRIPYKHEEE